MLNRRKFLKSSVGYGVSILSLPALGTGRGPTGYSVRLDTPTRLFDGKTCWTHPRVGLHPSAGNDGSPLAVMTMSLLDLSGSDVFTGTYGLHSDDLGKNWTAPYAVENLNPRHELIEGVNKPVAISDFWPQFHRHSKKILGIGHTVVYTPEWKVANPRPRHTAFSVYDAGQRSWAPWQKMQMPAGEKFANAGAGCVQRYDEADGSIILPLYFSPPGSSARVTVARCTFDGTALRYAAHGNELSVDDGTRGLHEPSVTKYQNTYFLTIRNDQCGYVTRSRDGLHFEQLQSWKFDDGTDLGNYNTQQHWVRHSDALFLVYTRRGAQNDHVFRHRAPLFMAEVDPDRLCVIRETERVLIPERGARLGNFGVTEVGPDETWVTVSEWMQPEGVEKYGSDGSVYVARIHWERANTLFEQ